MEWDAEKKDLDPHEKWAKQTYDAILGRCASVVLIGRMIKLEAQKDTA